MNTSDTHLTIEDVERDFSKWRSSKEIKSKIPRVLWDKVAKLLKHYPPTTVIKKLRLSSKQLKKNGLSSSTTKASQLNRSVSTFVEMPLQRSELAASSTNFLIKRKEYTLSLSNPSCEQIQHALTIFMQI